MKKGYLILIIVVVLLVSVLLFLLIRKKDDDTKKVEIKDIVYFHFSYSNGYMANAHIIYNLDYDNGRYTVSIKPHGIPDEEKVVVDEPIGFRDKLKEIMIKYDISKWNGFKKYAKDVLDGDDFSLHVKMVDDNMIEADGYMMWPENYRMVRDELDKLFMEIYNKEKGINENE